MRVPLSLPRRAPVFVIALALTACPANKPGPAGSSGTAVTRGGTLQVVLAEDVASLDPHRATSPSSWFFARALHRGLLAFPNTADGSKPVPDLASSFETSTDSLRYTFHLRDARFGAPASRAIIADDVRASIARVLRADVGVARYLWVIAGAEAYARGLVSQIEGIQTPDARTVVIRLARASTDLAWVLAQPQVAVLPAQLGDGPVDPAIISSSGPYTIERYTPERSITLVRSTAAGDDPIRHAYVDRIEATIGIDVAHAAARIRAGTADLLLDTGPPDLGPASLPGGARAVSSGCTRYLFFSPAYPKPAAFPSRAALDNTIRALPGDDLRAPASGLIPSDVVGASSGGVATPRGDPKGARAFVLTVGDTPRDHGEAAAIKRLFATVNVVITIKTVLPSLLARTYQDHATHAGIATWCADWPGLAGRDVIAPIAGLVRAPLPMPCGPAGRTAVARGIAGAQTAGEGAASAAWAALDRAVLRTCNVVPLYRPREFAMLGARVTGYSAAPMFPRGDPTGLSIGG